MTAGIIPTAFKKMIRKHNDPSKARTYDQFDHEEILQLQQDLIAEIKKIPIEDYFEHYQPHHHSCSSKCNLDIIRTLLGTESETKE